LYHLHTVSNYWIPLTLWTWLFDDKSIYLEHFQQFIFIVLDKIISNNGLLCPYYSIFHSMWAYSCKIYNITICSHIFRFRLLSFKPFVEQIFNVIGCKCASCRAVTNPKKFRIRIRIQMRFLAEFRIRIL